MTETLSSSVREMSLMLHSFTTWQLENSSIFLNCYLVTYTRILALLFTELRTDLICIFCRVIFYLSWGKRNFIIHCYWSKQIKRRIVIVATLIFVTRKFFRLKPTATESFNRVVTCARVEHGDHAAQHWK